MFPRSRRSRSAKQMLVSAVQSGELDLPAYCEILRERVVRDKVSFKASRGGKGGVGERGRLWVAPSIAQAG